VGATNCEVCQTPLTKGDGKTPAKKDVEKTLPESSGKAPRCSNGSHSVAEKEKKNDNLFCTTCKILVYKVKCKNHTSIGSNGYPCPTCGEPQHVDTCLIL
jgi:hypothetical protein